MSENTNVTLSHPTIAGVTQEVAAKDAAAWEKAGWVNGKAKAPAKIVESDK